jgi:hypothetical protein
MKYLNPIYETMCQNGYRELAYKWFNENKDFYHPIAKATLRKLMMLGEEPGDAEALERHEAYKSFLKA